MRIVRSLSLTATAIMLAVTATTAAVATAAAAATPSRHTSPLTLTVPPAGHLPSTGTSISPDGVVHPDLASPNWSGYVATGGVNQYTSVTSSWVQPAVPCSVNGAVSIWVGLDGWTNTTVEQTGTGVDCRTGTPSYYAWYEMYPAGPVKYSDPIHVGDNFTATVTRNGTSYTLAINDLTLHWTESRVVNQANLQNANAEVIVEAPSAGGILPLPDFGFTGFHGSTINGASLAAAGAQFIDMTDPNGGTATVSALDAYSGFTDSHGNAGNITGTPKVAFTNYSYFGGLWAWTTSGSGFLGQNPKAGTNPSIVTLPGGGFEGAFQSVLGVLQIFGSGANSFTFNTQLGMAPNTSPSIAVQPNGTFQVEFQNDGNTLWSFTLATGGRSQGYAMVPGSSPSITALAAGGFETAFEGSNGDLYEVGSYATPADTGYQMSYGTSPSITAVAGSAFKVAFQAYNGALWTHTIPGTVAAQPYTMKAATNPSIAALTGGGYEIAFQGGNGDLFEVGTYINFDTILGMAPNTSPSIVALPGVVFEIAFQANTNILYTQTLQGGGISRGQAMVPGTSPAITA